MKDHNFIDDNGNRMPVSEMSVSDIREILFIGDVEIIRDDDGDYSKFDILERLRIELIIRGEK